MEKIFLATPLRPNGILNIETALFCSLMDKRSNVLWGYIKTFSAEMSRNNLIEDHNNSHRYWTHIFFVDFDVVPLLYALDKLLNLDADIATGVYPILLKEGIYWAVADEEDNWIPYHEELPAVPFETKSCGAGCLLIKKEVLDDIGWPYFKFEYQKKWENNGCAVKTGEDIYFCRKAIDAGYKIIAHPEVRCGHYKQAELNELYKVLKKQIETKSVKKEKA